MYVIVAAVLCLTTVSVSASHHEIHKRMTIEEVQQTFGTNHEDVPGYKLAKIAISSMQKRSTIFHRQIQIQYDNEDINLSLKHTDGFLAGENTPVTMAIASGDELRYVDYPHLMKRVGQLLQDPRTGSSFILSQNRDRRYALDGYIASRNLVIRSLPERLIDSSSNNSNLHIIYRSKEQPFQPEYPYITTQLRMGLSKNGQEIPSIIYPELLLVMDSSSYRFHGSSAYAAIRYMLMLWNSVDMRYRNLSNPKVRLNIARIIIAQEPEGTPYIKSSMINATTVDGHKLMNETLHHFYRYRKFIPLTSYDANIIMIRHHMVYRSRPVLGLANPGGVCASETDRERAPRNAVFSDQGIYSSSVPAHELGHVLGADHDGQPSQGSRCPGDVGYIMGLSKVTEKSWSFSPCSIEDIRNRIELNPKCLFNEPKDAGKIIPRILADKSMTIDEQCRLIMGSKSCPSILMPKENFCRTLPCLLPNRFHIYCYRHPVISPADGTPCDASGNKICSRGECVSV